MKIRLHRHRRWCSMRLFSLLSNVLLLAPPHVCNVKQHTPPWWLDLCSSARNNDCYCSCSILFVVQLHLELHEKSSVGNWRIWFGAKHLVCNLLDSLILLVPRLRWSCLPYIILYIKLIRLDIYLKRTCFGIVLRIAKGLPDSKTERDSVEAMLLFDANIENSRGCDCDTWLWLETYSLLVLLSFLLLGGTWRWVVAVVEALRPQSVSC